MTDDAILREFLVEAKENLDALDQNLVALERNPSDQSTVDNIFRSLHSIKGAAGFFDFAKLESIAHAGENLLNLVREGVIGIDTHKTSLLLTVLDAMRDILASLERGAGEGTATYADLIQDLNDAIDNPTTAAAPAPESPAPPPAQTSPAPPAPPAATPPPAPDAAAPRDAPEDAAETIRVDVTILDELMDLVGELVLSRNQILQLTQHQMSGQLTQSSQQLNRITTELQERVMKTRMQPIKQVWSRFPRIVRDLSVGLGKRVRVEMEGKETELDRTLIEAIKDPLTHLVRNSVDHGIEPPDARIAAGKEPEGRFSLRAYHESGQVIIEVEDDGAGIDPERVKRKAVEKGLITSEAMATMTAKEALNLVFRPGFSTAERVTNISGRGVGMDVVRSNIEKIGGSIDVESRVGQGTRFRIKIPLTLAIIPALMVSARGGSFAIPQVNVVELIRVKAADVEKSIELVQGAITMRLRGRILPLVDFGALLAGRSPIAPSDRGAPDGTLGATSVNIAILQANKKKFGLLVDGIEESQEIVVKPLGRQLQDIPMYAGATILGDGTVALILDTLGLAQESGLLVDEQAADQDDHDATRANQGEMQTVLLVQDEADGRLAIPLSTIARLEKFPLSRIEVVGGREVVQYGDDILRLVRLHDVLPMTAPRHAAAAEDGGSDHVYVVVFADGDTPLGLVTDRILDVAETPVSKLKPPTRRGVRGTSVIRDRVTEFLDVDAMKRAGREIVQEASHA